MSRASLAIILSKLKPFTNPSVTLEQYPTPSEAAATILWDASEQGLIKDKTIIDLGCGTGILGIGALLMGAKHVIFVDLDPRIKEPLAANIAALDEEYELGAHEVLITGAANIDLRADLVLTNPPFGTKEEHADRDFLDVATRLAPHIYSFHKTSTNDYITTFMESKGYHAINHFPFKFSLPKTMPHHEKRQHTIAVTCWHFSNI